MPHGKLVVISPYPLPNNGISYYTEHYIKELSALGFEVYPETLYFLKSKLGNLKWLYLLFKHLPGRQCKVLIQHTPTISGPLILLFLLASRLFKVKVIIVSHEAPSTYAKYLKGFLKGAYFLYERLIYSWCGQYIVHTRFHRDELLKIAPGAHINLNPLPIYKYEISLIKRKPTGWAVYGQISPKKGLDQLIEAYQSFPAGSLPVLDIYGSPSPGKNSYLDVLKNSVENEWIEHINFPGYLKEEEKQAVFSCISILIFPYRWISQSAALSEACLYEIPYLASDIPFFKEFHSQYGCGRLFTQGSVASLKQALNELKQNPIKESECDFTRVKTDISLKHCAKTLAGYINAR